MKEPILALKNVYKFYSDDFTLEDITLDLYAGEVHVVVGENGSGKSTIMKIITGIIPKDKGEIHVFGKEVNFTSAFEAKKEGILYIMQDNNLFQNLSVAENVFFDKFKEFNTLTGINYIKLKSSCKELLESLNVSIDVDSNVSKLGLAQKQLIELVKAYVSDAKIIIFDEPSAAFTDIERDILFFIISYLKEKGIGIFYISHRLDDISHIGDRISVLLHGKLVGTKLVSESDKTKIIQMMTNKTFEERYPKLPVDIGNEILKVQNLKSGFIIKDVSFTLHKREILGITGLIGSGRSYLANCLFGSIPTDNGYIFVENKLKIIKNTKDAFENGIILLPENRIEDSIFENLDTSFNMSISSLKRFTEKYKINTHDLEETVVNYIDKFNIKPRKPKNRLEIFSGGNQQKIILSKLIMTRSKIFILDDPTRGIDVASKIDIYNAMNDIVSKGGSIIFISSNIEELLGMCDNILVLSEGRIVGKVSAKEATKEKLLYLASQ